MLRQLGLATDRRRPRGELRRLRRPTHRGRRRRLRAGERSRASGEVKHELFADIESALGAEDDRRVVGLGAHADRDAELGGGRRTASCWAIRPTRRTSSRFVEVLGNERTGTGCRRGDAHRGFYESVGKVTIEVGREVPGHVANQLQAALSQQAIHLVMEGVAGVDDVDTAVWAGPGLRWAAMGPTTLFHLGAGEGGLASFCERYADSFNRWWDDLGTPHLDPGTAARIVAGLAVDRTPEGIQALAAERDELLTAVVAATHGADPGHEN